MTKVEQQAAVLESIDVAVMGLDLDGSVVTFNSQASLLFGIDPEDLVGTSMLRLLPALSTSKMRMLLRRAADGERVVHEVTLRSRRLEVLWTPTRHGSNDVIGVTLMTRDVTDQQRRLTELYHFEALVKSSEDAIYAVTVDGLTLSWNPAAQRLFGYTPEEVLGQPLAPLILPEHTDDMNTTLRKIVRGRPVAKMETVGRHKSGSTVDLAMTISPVLDDFGDVVAISVIARDITEQKQVLRKLFHLSALVESSEDAIYSQDLDGIVSTWNRAAERLYGYTRQEIVGKAASILAPAKMANEAPTLLDKIKKGKKVEHYETEWLRKDGSTVEVQMSLSPIKDELGDVIGASVIARDVSERKREEMALRHFRAIVESSNDAIIGKGLDGIIDSWNAGAEKLYGYTAREMVGTSIMRLAPPDRSGEHAQFVAHIRHGERISKYETKRLCKDGTVIDVALTLSPILDEEGMIRGISTMGRDITPLKQAEEVRIAGEAAVRASRAKSDFLANMSHEIRTPMNAIIGMAELLSATSLNQEQQTYVRLFREAGSSLLDIVNDILDFSKVEAGEIRLAPEVFNLTDVLDSVLQVLAIRAHEKGLELNGMVSRDLPTMLVGDPGRLRQMLMNVIGNAVKFTERGEIVVRVTPDMLVNDMVAVKFAVTDSGPGIAAEHLQSIFEPFSQVAHNPSHSGTGLGLSITQRLVDLMGGRLWAESKLGEGSTFYFTCRFTLAAVPQVRAKAPQVLGQTRVLVVDDNATNRIILQEMLVAGDAEVEACGSGREALQILRRAASDGAPFHVVLLDCRMPDLDGFAVADQIRQDESLHHPIIMMLTSDQRKDDIDRVREMGLAAFLVKPVRQVDLYRVLGDILGRPEVVARIAAQPAVERCHGKGSLRILLVEDQETNRFLVREYLKRTPHRLEFALNGQEAVDRCDREKFDVVLMDIRMPVMNGYEATRMIRQRECQTGRPRVPIVAVTASAVGDEVERALEAGCDFHLSKPIARALLLDFLENLYSQNS